MTTFRFPLPDSLLRAGIAPNDSPRDLAGKKAMNICVFLGLPCIALPYGIVGLKWGLPNYLWFAGLVAVWHAGMLTAFLWTSTLPDPNTVHRYLSRLIAYGTITLYIPVTTWLVGAGRGAGFPQIWAFLIIPFVFLVFDDLRESWLILLFMLAAIVVQEWLLHQHARQVPLGPTGFVDAMRIFDWFGFTVLFGYVLALHRREMDQATQSLVSEIATRTALAESLQAATARAEAAVAANEAFLANMSHEIRTPMNAIVGMTHLALSTGLSERQRSYVERTQDAATHLISLINNLLDHSRFAAGGIALDEVDFHVDDVYTNLANVTGVLARKQGLELVLHVAPDVPEQLRGDPLRLGQILVNLTANAVKFTTAGVVVVSIRVVSRTTTQLTLELRVQDTGIGMSAEEREGLFQAFTQADTSIPRRFGGSGLGLSIAHQLVRAMGGTLVAESEVGKGSVFHGTVILGIAKGTAARWEVPAPYATALVVDDQPQAAAALAATLTATGIAATTVHSGDAAVQAATARHFDWVFVDEVLSGEEGQTVVQRLRALPTLRDTPFVLLTHGDVLLSPEGLAAAGILQALEKPVLRSAVRNLSGVRTPRA